MLTTPLSYANNILAHRDRARQERGFAEALFYLLPLQSVRIKQCFTQDGGRYFGTTILLTAEGMEQVDRDVALPADLEQVGRQPHYLAAIEQEGPLLVPGAPHRTYLSLRVDACVVAVACLEHQEELSAAHLAGAHELVNFYESCLSLLDYSERDTLTGLLNRKTLETRLTKLAAQCTGDLPHCEAGCGGSYWLGILDLDRFKEVNDRYGHAAGDEVLQAMANNLSVLFRADDHLYRLGGEEFVVVLHTTAPESASHVFERTRAAVAQMAFPHVGGLTVSLGYTRISKGAMAAQMLRRADSALYFAKANGRNQIQWYESLVAAAKLTEQS